MTPLEVDTAMAAWRQGDFVLGELPFLSAADPSELPEVQQPDPGDPVPIPIETTVPGLVVLTQTCDIVRPSEQRPFLELAPLLPMSAQEMEETRRGMRPRYAFLHGAAPHGLVADLDRVMTISKRAFAHHKRLAGCHTDQDVLAFAQALGRKRARFAFEDDFATALEPLRRWMAQKHGKQSSDGIALRAVKEIRVLAEPNWLAEAVHLSFYFIVIDGFPESQRHELEKMVRSWMDRLKLPARFASVDPLVVQLVDMTGADYAGSAQLDLDHLSMSTSR